MVEDGVEVKMSKRTGNAITLRELCDDLGVDAARWFFVSKDIATQMDLDLKFARTRDNNNPVYYAQYAYSRMNSIMNKEEIPDFVETDAYPLLTDEKEMRLMKLISEFPNEVAGAAKTRKPNKITEYIMTFVKLYHSYYNSVHVNNPDNPELTNQRLGLTKAAMITLKNALELIGVSAPDKM
jgi:arginyl-tRNA synthetase